MKDVSRRGLALTLLLGLIAGYIDAIGFIETGGLFVSFMSGNSTQAGAELWAQGAASALLPLGLVAAFVIGVAAGALSRGPVRTRRWRVVAGAAVAVAICGIMGLLQPVAFWRFALLAAAMGALNTLYLSEGRARIAITYATGTLVSLGVALADLITGRSRTAWRRPLLLWGSLAAGAVVGAGVERLLHGWALLVAAGALGILAVAVGAVRERSVRPLSTPGDTLDG